jgi:hypothetical protein
MEGTFGAAVARKEAKRGSTGMKESEGGALANPPSWGKLVTRETERARAFTRLMLPEVHALRRCQPINFSTRNATRPFLPIHPPFPEPSAFFGEGLGSPASWSKLTGGDIFMIVEQLIGYESKVCLPKYSYSMYRYLYPSDLA